MGYFLIKESEFGEVASFVSPKIFDSIQKNEKVNKTYIIDLEIQIFGEKSKIIVDIDFLEKHKISKLNSKIVIAEDNKKSMNLLHELKPIQRSLLKQILIKK